MGWERKAGRPIRGPVLVLFTGQTKLAVEVLTGRATFGLAESDASEQVFRPEDLPSAGLELYRQVQPVIKRVRACLVVGDSTAQEQRLASWGY